MLFEISLRTLRLLCVHCGFLITLYLGFVPIIRKDIFDQIFRMVVIKSLDLKKIDWQGERPRSGRKILAHGLQPWEWEFPPTILSPVRTTEIIKNFELRMLNYLGLCTWKFALFDRIKAEHPSKRAPGTDLPLELCD